STALPCAAANDANTCRNHNLLTVHGEGESQSISNAVRDTNGIAGVTKFGGEHDKFVAPRPRERIVTGGTRCVAVRSSGNSVRAAQACCQSTSYLDKKFVSQRATETIVDHFELIDVDEQNRKPKIPVSS